MPITVPWVEGRLLNACGPYLERTGLDFMTADGTNDDLAGPIADAVLFVGGTLADPTTVSDADLAGIEGFGVKRFLDVCRWYTLEACKGNWAKVDFSAGGNSQSLNQLYEQLVGMIAETKATVLGPDGPGVTGTAGGAATAQLWAGRCATMARSQWLPGCGTPWTGRGAY